MLLVIFTAGLGFPYGRPIFPVVGLLFLLHPTAELRQRLWRVKAAISCTFLKSHGLALRGVRVWQGCRGINRGTYSISQHRDSILSRLLLPLTCEGAASVYGKGDEWHVYALVLRHGFHTISTRCY